MAVEDTVNLLEKRIIYLETKVKALEDLITTTMFNEAIKVQNTVVPMPRVLFNQELVNSKEVELLFSSDTQRSFLEIGRHSDTGLAELDELIHDANSEDSKFKDQAEDILSTWLNDAMKL